MRLQDLHKRANQQLSAQLLSRGHLLAGTRQREEWEGVAAREVAASVDERAEGMGIGQKAKNLCGSTVH
ncbi:MAG: hypothetical protein PUG30_05335 [Actinomycetaceae bacterium]|nr:hypothetical protein [Actinomycetaceae bacterium]